MYFHKAQEKPRLYGSFQDRQYSIWRNLEEIYQIDHESEVLIMPLFWGLPPLDYSGYGNHGTNHGATYKDGSLDFDGNNDFVSCPQAVISGTDFTISFWEFSSGSTNTGYFCGDSNNPVNLYLRRQAGTPGNYFGGIASSGSEFPAISVSRGVWHHNSITHSSGVVGKWYVDGIWKADTANITTFNGLDNAFYIGNRQDLARAFLGTIDEVRISNVARTNSQIALFHDRPWDLYLRVARPIWSIPAAPPAGNPMWYYEMIGRE